MSLLARLAPAFATIQNSLLSSARSFAPSLETTQGGFAQSVRTVIRCHFPRPSERKRVKRHGWEKRMSTDGGRRTLMRRILKGKHVYSH